MAYDLSQLDYPDEVFNKTDRDTIYKENLKLDLRFINEDFYKQVDSIIRKYLKIPRYSFSAIYAEENCNIHNDVSKTKEPKYQRYANLAIPIKIDVGDRRTFWPKLSKEHSNLIEEQSFLDKTTTEYYVSNALWNEIYEHKELVPVLLNTSEPHGVLSKGYSFFVYITIPNTSYVTCYNLYNNDSFYTT